MDLLQLEAYVEPYSTDTAITSYQVFNYYINRDEKQRLIKQQILSPECYEHWVATRQRKLKYPRESFQRTVTAHIRAADGRQPFEPDVEEALLKEIRRLRDRRMNPFSVCFREDCGKTYRSRKLKSNFARLYGHHEKRKMYFLKKQIENKKKPEIIDPAKIKKQLASYMGMTLEEFELKQEVLQRYGKKISLEALHFILVSENIKLSKCYTKEYILGVTKGDFESISGRAMQQLVNMETFEVMYKDKKYIEFFGHVDHLAETTQSAVYNVVLLGAFYPQYLNGKAVTFRMICKVSTGFVELIVLLEPINESLGRFQYKVMRKLSSEEAPVMPLF